MIASKLDLKKLFLNFVNNFDPTEFVFLHFVRHVRNHKRNHNLESDHDMLNANGKEDDVGAIPVVWVSLLQELRKHRLFLCGDRIKILIPAYWHLWEATDQEDQSVAGDRKVRDEAHDRHPVAHTVCILGYVSLSKPGQLLKLNPDLQQVRQEGEKWRKWERNGKESHEAKLNDGFVIEGHEGLHCGLHCNLFLDLEVHLQISEFDLILSQSRLLDWLFEQSFYFLNLVSNFNFVLVVLHYIENNLFDHHDYENVY